jgi:hypothetical protein
LYERETLLQANEVVDDLISMKLKNRRSYLILVLAQLLSSAPAQCGGQKNNDSRSPAIQHGEESTRRDGWYREPYPEIGA